MCAPTFHTALPQPSQQRRLNLLLSPTAAALAAHALPSKQLTEQQHSEQASSADFTSQQQQAHEQTQTVTAPVLLQQAQPQQSQSQELALLLQRTPSQQQQQQQQPPPLPLRRRPAPPAPTNTAPIRSTAAEHVESAPPGVPTVLTPFVVTAAVTVPVSSAVTPIRRETVSADASAVNTAVIEKPANESLPEATVSSHPETIYRSYSGLVISAPIFTAEPVSASFFRDAYTAALIPTALQTAAATAREAAAAVLSAAPSPIALTAANTSVMLNSSLADSSVAVSPTSAADAAHSQTTVSIAQSQSSSSVQTLPVPPLSLTSPPQHHESQSVSTTPITAPKKSHSPAHVLSPLMPNSPAFFFARAIDTTPATPTQTQAPASPSATLETPAVNAKAILSGAVSNSPSNCSSSSYRQYPSPLDYLRSQTPCTQPLPQSRLYLKPDAQDQGQF